MNGNLIGDALISNYNCGFRRQPGVDIYRADLLRTGKFFNFLNFIVLID